MSIQAILITGRTIKQGIGLAKGKRSALYIQETGTAELSAKAMESLGVRPGDTVIVSTDWGEGVFKCRSGDLPDSTVFIPYGPPANRLVGQVTRGSGMPAYKGIACQVRRCNSAEA